MASELPILDNKPGSIQRDGSRRFVHPADVSGRFTRLRYLIFALLIGLWIALPLLQIGGHPALFLDVDHRKFYLFGNTFNAQDFWLVFFLATGVGFALIFVTALWGRVWCGYACPQTVFLEALFRRVERLIEGNHTARMRLHRSRWGWNRIWRTVLKHGAFILLAVGVAHIFLSYFVSLDGLLSMVRGNPEEHPEAFAWMASMSLLMYANFAWFREQLCMIVCPYGRLQSVLTDDDSVIIGYDERRGEKRGKTSQADAGDCVDCRRCVVVCPTGIDIRNGLQMECIGCAACVDACDEIMTRLRRPQGLIRYDSLRGLGGGKTQLLRSRIYLYLVLAAIGTAVAMVALSSRTRFEANLLRNHGSSFTITDGVVQNAFEVHVVNKGPETAAFRITPSGSDAMEFIVPIREPSIPSLGDRHVPVVVHLPVDAMTDDLMVEIEVIMVGGSDAPVHLSLPFAGPRPNSGGRGQHGRGREGADRDDQGEAAGP